EMNEGADEPPQRTLRGLDPAKAACIASTIEHSVAPSACSCLPSLHGSMAAGHRGGGGAAPAGAINLNALRQQGFRAQIKAEGSLPPGLEGLVERLLAGIAFFQRQDRAAAVVVDDRNIEPGALLQELQIALHVGLDRRQ